MAGYDRTLSACLQVQPLMLLCFFATLAGSVWLVQTAPKGFFPQEDIGQLRFRRKPARTFPSSAMEDLQTQVAQVFRRSPYVAHVVQSVGRQRSGALLP